jgi:hypothetical protein
MNKPLYIDNIYIMSYDNITFTTNKNVTCQYNIDGRFDLITYIYDLYNRIPIEQKHTIIVKKSTDEIADSIMGLRQSFFYPISQTFNKNGVNTFLLYLLVLSSIVYYNAQKDKSPFYQILTATSLTICFWYITFIPFWIMIGFLIIWSTLITKFFTKSVTGE